MFLGGLHKRKKPQIMELFRGKGHEFDTKCTRSHCSRLSSEHPCACRLFRLPCVKSVGFAERLISGGIGI